eukprot:GHVL01004312.1.p1 GENE.GHVL01004312.1~~GHVL01004312.1.p1  ORF type:complete len:106 (-),score=3.98 GHVL01004312.1:55-372(-)
MYNSVINTFFMIDIDRTFCGKKISISMPYLRLNSAFSAIGKIFLVESMSQCILPTWTESHSVLTDFCFVKACAKTPMRITRKCIKFCVFLYFLPFSVALWITRTP